MISLTSMGVGCASVCPSIPAEERSAFLAARPEAGGYIIQPQDTLSIEVWENPQLTRTANVRPDGKITLPLIDEIRASGLSVLAFREALREDLKRFIKNPIVNITVTDFKGKQIYLQGEVGRAAAYPYEGDVFLLQALALSGGVGPFAEGCAIVVRRQGDAFLRYDVELAPLMSGERLDQNISLQPNDVVTVH